MSKSHTFLVVNTASPAVMACLVGNCGNAGLPFVPMTRGGWGRRRRPPQMQVQASLASSSTTGDVDEGARSMRGRGTRSSGPCDTGWACRACVGNAGGPFGRDGRPWRIISVASKAVANRLMVMLPEIISEEQFAFVPGKLNTDNIVTPYECLHFMKKKRPVMRGIVP